MTSVHPASFRDPSGFVFEQDGVLYRQVNPGYREHYDRLMASGLYATLTGQGLLLPHEEVSLPDPSRASGNAPAPYKTLRPERVPFISYPYEWCFSQLKHAALATLRIQRQALDAGMSLKDASAYNIQFFQGRPVLIDSLSFEGYQEGRPWVAYRQFCQHFLAPLALAARTDARLQRLLQLYPDGVPLELAAKLLPLRSRLSPGLTMHLHLHARAQGSSGGSASPKPAGFSHSAMLGLIDSLEGTLKGLSWKPAGTVWSDYYERTNYSDRAFSHKQSVVAELLDRVAPKTVWDLGANDGTFARVAAQRASLVVAMDMDPAAVEQCYLQGSPAVLPLVMDLMNPSPSSGWDSRERAGLAERGPADCVLALALVHHLAIANNVPLARIAEFFARLCHHLIVEFVPKSDSQVQGLLAFRRDIFPDYTAEGFEAAFSGPFKAVMQVPLDESERVVYLMERR